MQSSRNAIDISSASVVDLKAELFKQKEEFKQQKAAAGDKPISAASRLRGKKLGAWAQNKGVSERAKRDQAALDEDGEPTLEASRIALEKKAKLYDKLKKTGIEDETLAEEILVDFDRKAFEEVSDDNDKDENDKQDEKNEEDPWVEYVDEFGRTRVARKSQVPKEPSPPLPSSSNNMSLEDDNEYQPTMMSADMYMEQERLRWEKEALEELKRGPQHYDETKEIRTKGVGFYRFSKDEQERQEQMRALKEMRNETLQKRALKQNIKDKRKLQLEARMALVRAKKLKTTEASSSTTTVISETSADNIVNKLLHSSSPTISNDNMVLLQTSAESEVYEEDNEKAVIDLLASIRKQVSTASTGTVEKTFRGAAKLHDVPTGRDTSLWVFGCIVSSVV
ncbi:5793_t:CDS:10 [Ambispora leptoticha]|uniref:5793_t:CDS:1 n=1 Tax=Ambispora leptoticha TaxID=144679 RepID=A0A9N8ZIS5_9GLOM|nr:5793_t:CDS:10 [Ambispora leptoticha]